MRRVVHDRAHHLLQPGRPRLNIFFNFYEHNIVFCVSASVHLFQAAHVDRSGQGEDDDTVELLRVAVQGRGGLLAGALRLVLGRRDLGVAEAGDEPEGAGLHGQLQLRVVVEEGVRGQLVQVRQQAQPVVRL